MSDADVPDETVFVADNVDEFVERTRHSQILEAKERAADALQMAELRRKESLQTGASRLEATRAARQPAFAAVEAYILECETLYQQTAAGQELWENAQLDTIDVRDALMLNQRPGMEEIVGVSVPGVGAVAELDVTGAAEFIGLNSRTVSVTYESKLNRRGAPTAEDETILELTVPLSTSREAYRCTNALLTSQDLGLKTGEEETAVEGDYAELLEKLNDDVNDE